MIRLLSNGAWLVVLWMALWGDLSAANLLGGALAAAALLTVFPLHGPQRQGTVRPLHALAFLGYFIYKLVEANLVVAWEVLTPGSRISLGVVAVDVRGGSDLVITTVANAISLTPGTLTLEVRRDPPTLYVHVLHLRSIEQTREDVRRLEYLALRAFGPDDVVARLTREAVAAERHEEDEG